MKTTRLLAPLALVAALVLAGCSDDPAEFDSSGGGATDAPSDAGGDDGGGQATVDEIDPTDVVAEYSVDLPPGANAPEGSTLTVGIHSLQVIDDVMLLEIYFTPEITGNDSESWSLYGLNGSSRSFWPTLTDREHLKQYQLISDGPNRWTVDNVYTQTTDGQPVLWWGYYAAPEDDIDSITIQVTEGHPVIDDVPIER